MTITLKVRVIFFYLTLRFVPDALCTNLQIKLIKQICYWKYSMHLLPPVRSCFC